MNHEAGKVVHCWLCLTCKYQGINSEASAASQLENICVPWAHRGLMAPDRKAWYHIWEETGTGSLEGRQ
jgi:hypothetical protein